MLKPLGNKILIEPLKAEEVTKAGIIIPDSAKEERSEGKVVAIGSGLVEGKEYKFSVKVGDKVLYGKYSGEEVKIDNKDYKVVKEDEILGTL
ncbi:co-chaperone GroES [Candidatus Berkelbacteria bacterium CG08_land_8_20_14_0_20_39_8]|uniref:Co-chaperonin GroES n=1 Tax=Candidatus Berkelbacteria bacterium CG08_land_8_20_14_0_20_39_8 TaxID=1974511 RepID=A0A2M6YCW9_9BACT|nr:MAG: co-chaperone GroES [Candidatus Berkelbacteria bacterium CG08_land_8_20_14_0_20_39_8]